MVNPGFFFVAPGHKRADHSPHTSDERPTKVPRWNPPLGSLQTKAQRPPSPSPPNTGSGDPIHLECQATTRLPLTDTNTKQSEEIYNWIPSPADAIEVDNMSQPPSKRSRSLSDSFDPGYTQSVPGSESSSARDNRSAAYRATNYVTILGTKSCFMQQSPAGPISEDITLCKQLLDEPVETPHGTLFDDEYIEDFHNALRDRSEARLLVDLHPLLMPSAENQYIQGITYLRGVIDGYNDSWLKTEPIYGPKPQPDHARGLSWSAFSETERRKLRVQPGEKSLYAARDEMYFPYLTAEIKCGNQTLEHADRQNMHSMCIALRAVVSLSRMAGCPELVHRRILGFSISHDLEMVRIYGHYPEIDGEKTSYFRWPIAQLSIWTKEHKWTCYRFVENVDRKFLPLHVDRLTQLLDKIPDPEACSSAVDVEVFSQVPRIAPQDDSRSYLTTSSQARDLPVASRAIFQALQQQLEEQKQQGDKLKAELKEREERLQAELKEREEREQAELKERVEREQAELKERVERRQAEQREREDRFLAGLEQQKKEQKAWEEELRAELRERDEKLRERDEKLRERDEKLREREERLLALLEQKDRSE